MADTSQLYKRAEEAFAKHNYDYARDLFMQILVLDPDHAQARKALKATILRKFQEQGATSKFKLMTLKGGVEIQLKTTKDPQKRIEFCQKHLNDDPTNAKVRTILADGLLQRRHFNGAAAEADMAFADDPKNVAAAKVLVAALIELKKVKEAQAILDRLQSYVREDRDLERMQRDLAAMQTMAVGFEDASSGKEGFRKVLKDAGKAAELEADHRLLQTEADILARIQKLEEELGENPTDARLPKKIGDIFFDLRKDYKTAQDWYRKASQLAPQDSVLRDKVDDCTLRMYDVQIEAAQKAGDPKLNEIRTTRLKFLIQSYERRVNDRPTDMGLRYELGRAYYVAGPAFTDKAIGEFQQSVKDPKKKAESHHFLALSFQRKKMYDMADKQYEQAEEGVLSQDRKLQILYNRAVCYKEAGKVQQAIDLGKRIMEIDISYRDIAKLVDDWQNGQAK